MPDILIVADDLTGAADTGAQFALLGHPTLLLLEPISQSSASVLVLTSESRAMTGSNAAASVRSLLAGVAMQHSLGEFSIIYKKIDSTLRGNPTLELEALLALTAEQRVLVAPAYPAQGRATRNGVVWIDDKPLSHTSFVVESGDGDLRQMFGKNAIHLPLEVVRQDQSLLKTIFRNHSGMVLADAVSDQDLLALSQAAFSEGIRVFCGSAGLAGALPHLPLWDAQNSGISEEPERRETPRFFLAVAGSLHASTIDQVAFAQRHGIEVITPPEVFFQDPGLPGIIDTAEPLASIFFRGIPSILSTIPRRAASTCLTGQEIAIKIARVVASIIPKNIPIGLFLTGGETALAVCRALGCKQLWLGGEVEPGMPWSRSGRQTFVTKAGAFGHEDALLKGINWLRTSAPIVKE